MRMRQTRGFTMVELLVVMAVIGILISLLMPAVSTVRESARRTACANNIRQLGMALNNYHQSHKVFPPAMFVYRDRENNKQDDPTTSTKHQQNWLVCLLPLIEQTTIYKKFDFKKPLSDQVNMESRSAVIPVLLCPSDIGSKTLFSRESDGQNWARGNYAANSSLAPLATNNVGATSANWSKGWLRGVMGADVACSIDEIFDGASSTILLSEVRVGLSDKDRRGTWALGGPGASSLWGHGTGATLGPNNCNSSSDSILGCQEVVTAVTRTVMNRECMGCAAGRNNVQATARSRHTGGVNACMVDASVRFINDNIDRSPTGSLPGKSPAANPNDPATQNFRIWERLNASADRLPVDMSKF
jgi:prepilin-type N-terminal cleavage/methylation domain-containing protein/prepilin-type processing-associated H-X9-DG protein